MATFHFVSWSCTYFLKEAYKRADEVLQSHKKELLMLADNLKKYETLNKEDVKMLLKGKQLKR